MAGHGAYGEWAYVFFDKQSGDVSHCSTRLGSYISECRNGFLPE